MDFRIADTFTDSLTRLSGDEQKAVKTTAFDLQMNPANPGMQFHRLDKAKDHNFWSLRVNNDIRIIVHRTGASLMLCYAAHHDDAYAWAERRKIEQHPVTGAAQLIEIRERVREVVVPRYVDATIHSEPSQQAEKTPAKPLFPDTPDWVFLTYGVPDEWLADVRAATEESLFDIADHLPPEASEALLNLATGTPLPVGPPFSPKIDAFAHPDAQRSFRVIENREELERALDYPWEKWIVFLHPAQRQIVERDFSGPARVSGSAGTGKTIVALHRAVHLARTNPEARILLGTFSETLANALRKQVRRLVDNQPRIAERLEVRSMAGIGRRLYETHFGKASLATHQQIQDAIREAATATEGQKFSPHFLWTEWTNVVDAWQLDTWDAYRDVRRLGRRTRLPEKQRQMLWSVFERTRQALERQQLITESTMFTRLASKLTTLRHPVFDYAVIDEAQDVSVSELRFLAALGADRPNALLFTGDLGQRIFQQPFSWSSLGIDVRGRASRLRVNYRTSHQIREHADRLLGGKLVDVDGVTEERVGTVSVFNGAEPEIALSKDETAERNVLAKWIEQRLREGLRPHEIAVFVRSATELPRAEAAVTSAGIPFVILDENVETKSGSLSIATMHLAKGLEFRAVAVMACDDEVIPLQERMASVADESDLDDAYATERHLLYVACTRARDLLLVSAVEPGSEFLADLRKPSGP